MRKPLFKWVFNKQGREFFLNAAKAFGALSVIYGVGFGIFQYIEAKNERRIEQSLALFRQFNTSPFTDYRKNINTVVAANKIKIYDAARDEKTLEAAVEQIVRDGKIETDLVLVMDFFDGVVYCAAKNICDANISYDLFYARARELYVTFYQYIKAQRSSFAGNDFGAGIETLVVVKKADAASNPRSDSPRRQSRLDTALKP